MPAAPKRLKAEDRRKQILNAAVRCFARHGYSGTTTAQLARAARVTEPVLYRHFENKQALFLALLDLAASEAMDMIMSVIGPLESPAEKLRALLRLNPAITDPRTVELYTVVFHAQTERNPRIVSALREHYCRYAEFLSGLIGQAQAAGQIRRDVSAVGLSWQIIHCAVGFAMIKPLEIPGHATRDAVEQIMALLMEQLTGAQSSLAENNTRRKRAARRSAATTETPPSN